MKSINQNNLAKVIAESEKSHGKRKITKEINIGDIKEILQIILEELGKYEDEQILKLINKHRED